MQYYAWCYILHDAIFCMMQYYAWCNIMYDAILFMTWYYAWSSIMHDAILFMMHMWGVPLWEPLPTLEGEESPPPLPQRQSGRLRGTNKVSPKTGFLRNPILNQIAKSTVVQFGPEQPNTTSPWFLQYIRTPASNYLGEDNTSHHLPEPGEPVRPFESNAIYHQNHAAHSAGRS